MFTDVPAVSPDVVLNDLFALSGEAKLPIAVVQPDGKLMGAIVRGAVLGALAGNVPNGTNGANEANDTTGTDTAATDTEGTVMSHATADR